MEITINKNRIILISLLVIVLISVVSTIIMVKQREKVKELKFYEDNYFLALDSLHSYKNINGTLTYKANILVFNNKELKNNIDKKDSLINKLKYTIINQKHKIKDLESILYTTIQSQGQGVVYVTDTVEIENNKGYDHYILDDGYLYQNIYTYNDSIQYDYQYIEEITVVSTKERELNKKGKKVFFLWRWIKPYKNNTYVSTNNPNSKIIVNSKIIFNK